MQRKAVVGMVVLLASFQARADTGVPGAMHEDLYAKSGFEQQLEQIPAMILEGMSDLGDGEHTPAYTAHVSKRIGEAIREIFTPDHFRSIVLEELKKGLTVAETGEVLLWLNSPLGAKCTQLEAAATRPGIAQEMEHYLNETQGRPPDPDRIELIKKLDSAVHASEMSTELVINTQIAIVAGMVAALPREERIPFPEIVANAREGKSAVAAMMHMLTVTSFAYVYHELTDAELHRYIEFARSPAGVRYHAVSMKALERALIEGALRFGAVVGEIVEKWMSESEA